VTATFRIDRGSVRNPIPATDFGSDTRISVAVGPDDVRHDPVERGGRAGRTDRKGYAILAVVVLTTVVIGVFTTEGTARHVLRRERETGRDDGRDGVDHVGERS
jgi:multisubunit Na+/H+ antiporter MnhC subunit